jgi:hypothetical protein
VADAATASSDLLAHTLVITVCEWLNKVWRITSVTISITGKQVQDVQNKTKP